MSEQIIKVLLVDDDEDDYVLTRDLLKEINQKRFELDWVSSYKEGLELIKAKQHEVYLVDFRLGEYSGIQLLQAAIRQGCRKPFIILTGQLDGGIDLLALKAGASDYLVKSKLDSYNLERAITYAIERSNVFEDVFEKEQKYRTLFENSHDAIFIVDTEYKFQEVNQATLMLFEYSEEELLTLHFQDLFVDKKEFSHFTNIIDEAQVNRGQEYTLKSKGGKKINSLITPGFITDSLGNVKGYQAILHDISHRKRFEAQLLATEKVGVMDRIARTIAHEVRNPLNTIVIALSRFKKEHPNEESYNFYTDIIDKSCKRIDQLISQLLESSRPSELNLQAGNINSLVEETLKLADDRIKLLNIKVETSYTSDLPLFHFDAEKLKIALLNIIINSVEAMKPEVGKLEINTTYRHGIISINIIDNGKGIPKENLTKLYDPFFTGKKGGMGLGLTSTLTIVRSHNGDINVESEVGIGTKFTISFEI